MKQDKIAIAKRPLADVSMKDSNFLFKHLRNKSTKKAKNLLNELIAQKKSIKGRYFTKTSKKLIELIESCEANAEAKGLDTDKLFIKHAQANKSFGFMLPKSRWSHRGRKAKICQLNLEIEER